MGPYPSYLVLPTMRGGILDQAALPPHWFYSKSEVASKTKWPSTLSGPIPNEGNILDLVAFPLAWVNTKAGVASGVMGPSPWLDLSKTRVPSRIMGHPPLSDPIQNEGCHPGSISSPP